MELESEFKRAVDNWSRWKRVLVQIRTNINYDETCTRGANMPHWDLTREQKVLPFVEQQSGKAYDEVLRIVEQMGESEER